MSKITTIRESIDNKLDQWQVSIEALEAQFDLSKENAMQRVESQKQNFNDTLDKFKTEINNSAAIANDIKTKINTQVDEVQVQLALGKAEARDAYTAQKEQIQNTVLEFEKKIDQDMESINVTVESSINDVIEEIIISANLLDAELEATQTQFDIEKAKAGAKYETLKNDITAKIKWFKNEVSEKKQLTTEKARNFEEDLSSGFSQIKQAFTTLSN